MTRAAAIRGTKQQEVQELESRKHLFHWVNLILRESYPEHAWNSLEELEKWRMFIDNDNRNEFESQLIENALRLVIEAIRREKERRSAIELSVV